jgi:AcrR family transcriptional regulator
MQSLLNNFKISVNPKIYVKDPETSDLGKKIIEHSILLMDEIGFENFTFKKLGNRIGSNESSIYRYFESKHKLLIYLSCWYWSWTEYKLVFNITNLNNAEEKLHKAIRVITEKIEDDSNTEHINEAILNKIIITEFTKTLHTKEIDGEIKEGFYLIYNRIINRIVDIIKELNPDYPFAKSLVSSIVEGSLHQHFLQDHFASITDCNEQITPSDFYNNLISIVIKK